MIMLLFFGFLFLFFFLIIFLFFFYFSFKSFVWLYLSPTNRGHCCVAVHLTWFRYIEPFAKCIAVFLLSLVLDNSSIACWHILLWHVYTQNKTFGTCKIQLENAFCIFSIILIKLLTFFFLAHQLEFFNIKLLHSTHFAFYFLKYFVLKNISRDTGYLGQFLLSHASCSMFQLVPRTIIWHMKLEHYRYFYPAMRIW